ncbi:NAC domain-containing protein 83 [Brachypodium distachyon]|uniref:NAC domain-containing protein n=1 Tax=Brachypodium distachyon TaxID=15368 RepID=I1H0S9_BRADI|nr:NAC domain-containing protein 83 [Brachypodium distachyon]KQK19490.1 hypothetical protein BRADI_1g48580v3 [Brachypodium distachyon]|eukprot:XP_003561060.1 NAC domain-containing protein 83 [Brachypodium distachyon]
MALPMAGGGLMGLPNGFRFVPTDEELTIHYLYKKAFSLPLPNNIIAVADLARIHPGDLPGNEAHGDKFFFSRPVPRCGRRARGAAAPGAAGVWKASGAEELVLVSPRRVPTALKQTLVFFSVDGRGVARTRWVMHEYRLHPNVLLATANNGRAVEDWVVCRVFQKATRAQRRGDGNPPSPISSCLTEEIGDEDSDEEIAS